MGVHGQRHACYVTTSEFNEVSVAELYSIA